MWVTAPAAATAATAVAPSLFRRRSLSSSSFRPASPLPPRHVVRVAPLAARPARLSAVPAKRHGEGGVVAAASAVGSAQFGVGDNENPYEILGISPLDGFDQVKMAYKRRRKDAESNKDAEYLLKLERGYDMVMMERLQNRKKGVPYGSIQVSKDIKYADNQPVVPWGPRYSRSTGRDLRINMAISATFIMYISTMGHADWKPLQFLCFAYFYRILDKLKANEPALSPVYNEYGEVEGRGIHMVKRVFRSLGLVLGSVLAVSLGYTGLANFSQFLGQYIPSVVYNFQVAGVSNKWTCNGGMLVNLVAVLYYHILFSGTVILIGVYLIPGTDCDYSFICFALHLGVILSIAICVGPPLGIAILIYFHPPIFSKGHAR